MTENRILRNQIKGRLRLTDPERISLAEIGRRLGGKALVEVAQIVRPETILGWHRQLIARTFDGSKVRSATGRTPPAPVIEELVLPMARKNRTWCYRRIVGAMGNPRHVVSHPDGGEPPQAAWVGPGAGTRKADAVEGVYPIAPGNAGVRGFFHSGGLDGCRVDDRLRAGFMRIAPRQIPIAGITLAPTEEWMKQIARNLTMVGDGFLVGDGLLNGWRNLLHDRDTRFSAAFCAILRSAGVESLALPPRSPNLNAHLERWNRSVKEECLSKLILLGEASLRHDLLNYARHHHEERNRQGKDNVILFPAAADRIGCSSDNIRTRERLGGLLKFYHRETA
ncbi:MAG: hypothetical protein RL077_216 [Verrucomicrobiota bacterium]